MRRIAFASAVAVLLALTVWACGGGSNDGASSTLTPAPTLVSLSIEGQPPAIGGASLYTATGRYSDNTTQAVGTLAAWQSSSPLVATVGATTGIVTGVSAGNTNITAVYLGMTAVKLITIAASAGLPSPAPSPSPSPSPNPSPSLTCDGATVPSVVDCLNNQGFQAPTAKCNDGRTVARRIAAGHAQPTAVSAVGCVRDRCVEMSTRTLLVSWQFPAQSYLSKPLTR